MVIDPKLTGKICPYCGKESELIDSAEVYGESYGAMYICRDCNAYVGCYSGTTTALGRLADADLRKAKMRATIIWISCGRTGDTGATALIPGYPNNWESPVS